MTNMENKALDIYGADGVLTNVDIMGALEKGSPRELSHYFIKASQFVAKETGMSQQEVYDGIKMKIRDVVFPNRDKPEHWHEFGQGVKIAPAVDHMLITPFATELFLKDVLAGLAPESETAKKITEFLGKKAWGHSQYKSASEGFEQDAVMEPDAIDALDYKLGQDHSVVIATNSRTAKIHNLLRKGGFAENRIIENEVRAGKIGIFNDVGKYKIDSRAPRNVESTMDLRKFGVNVQLDLRRNHYKAKILEMYERSGAEMLEVIDSIPELMASLPYLFGKNQINEDVFLSLKMTPNTTNSGLAIAKHIKARAGTVLSNLIAL